MDTVGVRREGRAAERVGSRTVETTVEQRGTDVPLPGVTGLEAALVATTPALVCVIAADGRLLLVNPALERSTGWRGEEVLGRLFWDVLVVPHEVALAQDCVQLAMETGEAPPQEGDWLDRWGGHRRVAMQNSVLRDGSGRPFAMVCVGVDVTAQREHEAELRERAESDVLTGLRNRAALLTALARELREDCAQGPAVLFCDLDGFKTVNDTHGHDVGDLLLREVAARLLAVTSEDDVVARFGGDEFVLLCRRADDASVAALRERIVEALSVPFVSPHGSVVLGASVGSAIGRRGDDGEALVAAADRHMYGVKTQRRRRRRTDVPRPDLDLEPTALV